MAKDSDFVLRIRDKAGRTHEYVRGVCLINTKHAEDGTPALCTFLRADQTINLAGGEEFMVCWVPREMVKR